jgi:hypothetical protein
MSSDLVFTALEQELNELPVEDSKAERPKLTHKTCTKCAIKKNIELFRPLTKNLKDQINYSGKCRECLSQYERSLYLAKHPNAKNKRGPKSQFDDQVIATIANRIAAGDSIRSIAITLGYSYPTLYSAYRSGKFSAAVSTIVNSSDDE